MATECRCLYSLSPHPPHISSPSSLSLSPLSLSAHQVISLEKVLKYPSPILEADTHYAEFGNAHNININEDTGFAYVVGTKTCA